MRSTSNGVRSMVVGQIYHCCSYMTNSVFSGELSQIAFTSTMCWDKLIDFSQQTDS